MADTQRQKTYDAESFAFEGTAIEVPVGLYALEVLAGQVARTQWFDIRSGGVCPKVRQAAPTATRSAAHYGPREIRIAHGQDTVATLAHELAHFAAPRGEGHGPDFRACEIHLVAMLAGPSAAERLAVAFANARLDVADVPAGPDCGPGGLVAESSVIPPAATPDALRLAERVNKLIAKANSTPSEAEAEALRAKAVELTVVHGIDAALLEAADGSGRIVERRLRIGAGPYVAARTRLLNILADHMACEIMWNNDRAGRVIRVLGFSSDVAAVLDLFAQLDHSAALGSATATFEGNKVRARRAWLVGFANGVREHLEAARTAAGLDDSSNPAALVLVERRKQVEAEHKRRHPRLRSVGMAAVRDANAFHAGRESGAAAAASTRRSVSSGRIAIGAGA